MSLSVGAIASLNSDSFLKLFIAQVEHQDPTEPMDPSQMMSELAQFTSVEKLTEMNSSFSSLLAAEKLGQARAVVGQEVTYSPDGVTPVSGTATAAEVQNGQAGVIVGNQFVPFDQIVRIRPVPAAAAA
jgi:flagellar basal-body rod modification protein FlgD